MSKTDSIDLIFKNIQETIKKLRRQGTVGMSRQNLKQITPTKGVMCPVDMYDRLFNEALTMLKDQNFEIYDCEPSL